MTTVKIKESALGDNAIGKAWGIAESNPGVHILLISDDGEPLTGFCCEPEDENEDDQRTPTTGYPGWVCC